MADNHEAQPSPSFAEFISRIRHGDEFAAHELVKRYESLIRREIRFGMKDSRLNRAFDSVDVCQSVWASFFLRTMAGEYDLNSPDQLAKLLLIIARNKLVSRVRHEQQARRDVREVRTDSEFDLDSLPHAAETPSEQLAHKELLVRLNGLLTHEERQLVALRQDGLSWDEIVIKLGGTSQARRAQLSRAVDRVEKELLGDPTPRTTK